MVNIYFVQISVLFIAVQLTKLSHKVDQRPSIIINVPTVNMIMLDQLEYFPHTRNSYGRTFGVDTRCVFAAAMIIIGHN